MCCLQPLVRRAARPGRGGDVPRMTCAPLGGLGSSEKQRQAKDDILWQPNIYYSIKGKSQLDIWGVVMQVSLTGIAAHTNKSSFTAFGHF